MPLTQVPASMLRTFDTPISMGNGSSIVFQNNTGVSDPALGKGGNIFKFSDNVQYHDNYDSQGFQFRQGSGYRVDMKIDSSGNLLVGTTSVTPTGNGISMQPLAGGSFSRIEMGHASGVGSGNPYMAFHYAGNSIGSITQNGTTAVAYNTSSDYRLKENIQPMQNALDVVAQLNPVTYTWKADGSDGQGFIAHELQAVVPDCVTGEKDAVDAEGNPVYQGIDTSFLVATLCKAIQELNAKVDAQAELIAALQAQ